MGNNLQVNVTGKGANVRFTGAAASGNWDNLQADANWTTSDAGIVDTTHYYDGDVVTFNDTNNGQYAISINSTVTPSAGVTVNNSAGDYTFNGVGSIAGLGSLVKTGTGALNISNTNTYTGGTTISQGTLFASTTNALGTGPVTVNNGVVNVNATAGLGTGPVTLNNGTLNANNANAFNGPVIVNGGTLNLIDAALGPTPATTLTINGGVIDSGAAVTLSTNNPIILGGSFAFGGSNNLNLGTGSITLNANPTVTLTAGQLRTGSAIINGTGNSITYAGAGAILLTGASSYSGTTTVGPGVTVAIGNSNAFGTYPGGAVTVQAGGMIDLGGLGLNTTGLFFGQKQFFIAGDGVGGAGAITSTASNGGDSQNAFQRITLTADASIGGINSAAGGSRFDIRAPTSSGINQAILDLAGHTLTINNQQFFGIVNVDVTDGNLIFNAPNNPAGSQIGSVSIEGTTNIPDFGTGKAVTVSAGSAITFFGFSGTFSRPLILNEGSRMGSNGTNAGAPDGGTFGSNVTLNGNAFIGNANNNGTGTMQLNGVVGGIGSITKYAGAGDSTLILAGNNTFTGGVIITGGTVQLNNAGALNSANPNTVTLTSSNTQTNAPPRLRLNGNSVTVNGLNSTGGGGATTALVENNHATIPATLTVTSTNSPTFDGILQDGGAASLSLATNGSGTFTLTGTNTYTGSTTIGAGSSLQLGAGIGGGTTGSIAGTSGVSGSGQLVFNRSNSLTFANPISGAASVTQMGSGTVTLSGANTYSGLTAINAGTLSVTGSLLSTGSVSVNSGGTLAGAGSVGNVTQQPGSTVSPGASPGTLTMNSLAVGGGNYSVDVGGDLINVTNTAHYTGPSTISPTAAVASGLYTILNAGTLTIDAGDTPTVNQISGSRLTFSLVTHTGANGNLQLNVVGNIANLIWNGSINTGGSFLWDVQTTKNWTNTNGNVADFFFTSDNVTFDDTGLNKTVTIDVPAGVAPTSVTVNNSTGNNYTFVGASSNGITARRGLQNRAPAL